MIWRLFCPIVKKFLILLEWSAEEIKSININADLGDKYERVEIKLFNVVGQLIRIYEIDQANEFSFLINGATGSYIVEILTSKNETTRVKVLKE